MGNSKRLKKNVRRAMRKRLINGKKPMTTEEKKARKKIREKITQNQKAIDKKNQK